MTHEMLFLASQASLIACALVAGVFLTFSDFVMKSLAATRPAGGIEAMQHINRYVFRTLFMAMLLGMMIVAPLLALYAWAYTDGPARDWLIAGGVLYTIGTVLVTLLGNVPMNMRLDRMDFESGEAARYWRHYVRRWTFWNSVRTAASAGAAIAYMKACLALV